MSGNFKYGRWIVVEQGEDEVQSEDNLKTTKTVAYIQFHTFFHARDARKMSKNTSFKMFRIRPMRGPQGNHRGVRSKSRFYFK